MFCSKCGTQLPDGTATCTNCGAALGAARPQAGAAAGAAADRMKAATTDALGAFKTFATDPVGGLPGAYEGLGPARSLGVGVTFGLVFALCVLVGVYRFLGEWGRPDGVEGFLKILVVAIVPFVALVASSLAARMVFGGSGTLGSDSFIGGAAILPFGIVALLASFLGVENWNIITGAALIAVCLTILMLFAGLTRIYKISERAASLAVPLMVILSSWLSKVMYRSMLQ